jgi:beta-glucosidase
MPLGAIPVLAGGAPVPAPEAAGLAAFPAEFVWGASTSAYQIEGAPAADGRRASIWDTFSHAPGNVLNGDTGDGACDHYQRWRDDLALMREIGLGGYRFSIAWPRILPMGAGPVNSAGLDWYERLVDALLDAGVQPWPTLYHWDLPQPLEDAGGWPARATAARFVEFADVVARRLGDRIQTWTTLNEPWCSAFLGYQLGIHAPGKRDLALALAASHNLLLAHGNAVEVIRAAASGSRVGIVLNPAPVEPESDSAEDAQAASLADAYFNRWFLDPLYGRGYPADMLQAVRDYFTNPPDADLQSIAAPIDFLGVNYYRPTIVRADRASDNPLGFVGVQPSNEPVTQMDWVVRASGLCDLLVRIHRDYPIENVAVTENGAAYEDVPAANGQVHDPERTRYIADHIAAVAQARRAGVPVTGYFVWSLLDNFEWAQGYTNRFGIVHVDFQTQQRTIKDSGRWYRQMIAAHRASAGR